MEANADLAIVANVDNFTRERTLHPTSGYLPIDLIFSGKIEAIGVKTKPTYRPVESLEFLLVNFDVEGTVEIAAMLAAFIRPSAEAELGLSAASRSGVVSACSPASTFVCFGVASVVIPVEGSIFPCQTYPTIQLPSSFADFSTASSATHGRSVVGTRGIV